MGDHIRGNQIMNPRLLSMAIALTFTFACDDDGGDQNPPPPCPADQIGTACQLGAGAGRCNAGTLQCINNNLICRALDSEEERCDGDDNDCDGRVDEVFAGRGDPCNLGGVGVCGTGESVCSLGEILCQQVVNEGAELCDGLDNDCDGDVDEGAMGGEPCEIEGEGVCGQGFSECRNGQFQCIAAAPAAESCNGRDDDCDGQTDETFAALGDACDTNLPGICGAGNTVCLGGQEVCAQNEQRDADFCDGLDNDCDGAIDENIPSPNCETGEPGICSAGTLQCNNGRQECVGLAQPARSDRCDGRDDDCDGLVDERWDLGEACVVGQGICATEGEYVCTDRGTSSCNAAVIPPEVEECDGIDNDCDGNTDEAACAADIVDSCRLSIGWARNANGAVMPVNFDQCWDNAAPNGNMSCATTRGSARWRLLRTPVFEAGDQLAVALDCDAGNEPAAYFQEHCQIILGYAVDGAGRQGHLSPQWGACPGRRSGVEGGLSCAATWMDDSFTALAITEAMAADQHIAAGVFCNDLDNQQRAYTFEREVSVGIGWATPDALNQGLVRNGGMSWGDCPESSRSIRDEVRCFTTSGSNRFHTLPFSDGHEGTQALSIAIRANED